MTMKQLIEQENRKNYKDGKPSQEKRVEKGRILTKMAGTQERTVPPVTLDPRPAKMTGSPRSANREYLAKRNESLWRCFSKTTHRSLCFRVSLSASKVEIIVSNSSGQLPKLCLIESKW